MAERALMPMQQLPLAIGPAPQPGFDNFVIGANAHAVAHLRGWVEAAGGPPPVYLWGAPGSGKTHLLHALAGQARHRGGVVGWYEPGIRLPWHVPPGCTLVVIDDCDALDAATQHAAFTLFVQAAALALPVAAAGRLPPVDLPLRDDLRTRLGWGHVWAIEPLADADARAALRREADRRGIFLSDEVVEHLLTRFARDLGSLMRLLDRIDVYSLARGRRVTLPLLRELLSEAGADAAPCRDGARTPVGPGAQAACRDA